MDGERFDAITRRLAAGASRRGALRLLAGGALGGLLARLGPQEAAATHAGCRHNGASCARAGQCCSGRCDSGTCRPCTKAGQCPQPANPCQRAVCTGTGRCALRDKPTGTACGEGQVCCGGVCTVLGTNANCGGCGESCERTCQACTGAGTCAAANEGAPCSDGTKFCRSGTCIGDDCVPVGGTCSNGGECCGGGCQTETWTCCATGNGACVEDADCCNPLLTCSNGVCG